MLNNCNIKVKIGMHTHMTWHETSLLPQHIVLSIHTYDARTSLVWNQKVKYWYHFFVALCHSLLICALTCVIILRLDYILKCCHSKRMHFKTTLSKIYIAVDVKICTYLDLVHSMNITCFQIKPSPRLPIYITPCCIGWKLIASIIKL